MPVCIIILAPMPMHRYVRVINWLWFGMAATFGNHQRIILPRRNSNLAFHLLNPQLGDILLWVQTDDVCRLCYRLWQPQSGWCCLLAVQVMIQQGRYSKPQQQQCRVAFHVVYTAVVKGEPPLLSIKWPQCSRSKQFCAAKQQSHQQCAMSPSTAERSAERPQSDRCLQFHRFQMPDFAVRDKVCACKSKLEVWQRNVSDCTA